MIQPIITHFASVINLNNIYSRERSFHYYVAAIGEINASLMSRYTRS